MSLRAICLHLCVSFVLVPVLLFSLVALSLRQGWISIEAHPDGSALEAGVARWAKRWASEGKYKDLRSPVAVNRENIESGAIYYREYCAQCHRGSSDSSPLDGVRFNPRPPGLAELQVSSDQELFWYAKRGIRVTGMPAFQEILSDEALWQIALFLKEQHRNQSALRLLTEKTYVESTPVEYTVDGQSVSSEQLAGSK